MHLTNISIISSLQEQIIILHCVCMFCVHFHVFTFHFLSLAAPAAEAKVASHFWASCLFVLDPLHLVTRTQKHTTHRSQVRLKCPTVQCVCQCDPANICWICIYVYPCSLWLLTSQGILLTWGTSRTSRSIVFFSLLFSITLKKKKLVT